MIVGRAIVAGQVEGVALVTHDALSFWGGYDFHTGTIIDASQARKGSRHVYFGTEFIDSPVYDGSALGPGATIEGPAIVEEPFTVVVLAPGNVARLDQHGNYDIAL